LVILSRRYQVVVLDTPTEGLGYGTVSFKGVDFELGNMAVGAASAAPELLRAGYMKGVQVRRGGWWE
jgi:hypothetical protein